MLLEATNPDPLSLPTLGVWQTEDGSMTHVSATFPNLPDFTCDSWCYESETDFFDARALDGGRIELRHAVRGRPDVTLVTTVTPEPECVEFVAHPVTDGALPDDLLTPNLCWQLRRAPSFASRPDPYPEFVKRCFIFTKDGFTRLRNTTRRGIPVRPEDHEYNNPPWVQMYLPMWDAPRRAGADAWADYSADHYARPVIGAVSRDEEHLTAIACAHPVALCQAWHDCMHNNPRWEDVDNDRGRVWRLRIYAMGNDPAELLRRLAHWLMQEPALEENDLRAKVQGDTLEITRRNIDGNNKSVQLRGPDGV
ncbi:hypothetical protein HOK31_06750, partial [Candidatus Poribacteria bacterium]|nr:hypothetical protein [Candidatus Poribacteria bacterium]